MGSSLQLVYTRKLEAKKRSSADIFVALRFIVKIEPLLKTLQRAFEPHNEQDGSSFGQQQRSPAQRTPRQLLLCRRHTTVYRLADDAVFKQDAGAILFKKVKIRPQFAAGQNQLWRNRNLEQRCSFDKVSVEQ